MWPTIVSRPKAGAAFLLQALRERKFAPPAAPEGQPTSNNTPICDGDPLSERVVLSEPDEKLDRYTDRRSMTERPIEGKHKE
jgi:hypothetical protein